MRASTSIDGPPSALPSPPTSAGPPRSPEPSSAQAGRNGTNRREARTVARIRARCAAHVPRTFRARSAAYDRLQRQPELPRQARSGQAGLFGDFGGEVVLLLLET